MQSCQMERKHTEQGEQKPDGKEEECALLYRQLAHMTAPHIAEHHAEDSAQYPEREK